MRPLQWLSLSKLPQNPVFHLLEGTRVQGRFHQNQRHTLAEDFLAVEEVLAIQARLQEKEFLEL